MPLIVFENPDKGFHEKPDPLNKINLPHPFRAIVVGPPNSGKTSVIKNIALNQKPYFQRILLLHIDPDSQEYSDIEAEAILELPDIDEIDPTIKNLLIIEDINIKRMSRTQKELLDRYFGYVSTHRNLSIIITAQDAFAIPVNLRRLNNVLILWRGNDVKALEILSLRFGYKSKTLLEMFDKLAPKKRDFIVFLDYSEKPLINFE